MEMEAANFVLSEAKMKKLTSIEGLREAGVSSEIGLIKQHVENGFPVDFSVDGNFLHTACFVGDCDLLQFLLKNSKEKGEDICMKMLNEKFLPCLNELHSDNNLYHLTPLQMTLKRRHGEYNEYKVCKLLVDYGADVNIIDEDGNTLLHYACTNQTEFTVELCKLFINNGAGINTVNKDGNTLLHFACMNQTKFTVELCKLFIDKEANVKLDNKYGNRPLHFACMHQTEFTVELCKVFIDNGAGVNFRNGDGNISLHSVLKSSFVLSDSEQVITILQLLLKYGANINSMNNNGETPIACLITNTQSLSKSKTFLEILNFNLIGMFQFLIEAGADLMIRTRKYSQTLYHCIVELAIEVFSNMCVGKQMIRQKEILTLSNELVALLTKCLEKTTLSNCRDGGGNTPLHLACKLTQKHCSKIFQSVLDIKTNCLLTSIVESLISFGSNLNAVNDKQQTPLHLACTSHAILTLLQFGAKPNLKDVNGNTPMLEWTLMNDRRLVELCFSVEDVTEYFKQGVDPYLANDNGDTVLKMLLSKENFVCASNLIKAVVDSKNVERKQENVDTFLHVVCKFYDERAQELIELLLKSGADPNSQNQVTEETPLHVLCRRIAQRYIKVPNETKVIVRNGFGEDFMLTSSAWAVQLLRKKGAIPEASDCHNKTCLDIALENRLSGLEKVLISPIEQIDDRFLLPWNRKSVKHSSMLSQVARHQKSKNVGEFHYHSESIASGTFAHVHVGISDQDGREIAVKIIKLLHLRQPEVEKEIKTLLFLKDCEHVVKYQLFPRDEHFLYIILELMDGSLDELNCREEYQHHVDLCRDVMSGIVFLHNNAVIHCDIKPSNILYKRQPDRIHLKLADFGLRKNLNLTLPSGLLTVMHSKAYTRCWSPVEVFVNGVHSEASDVFSAGLLLHYILAEKKHAFAPKDGRGMSDADIGQEVECSIRKGQLNLSETISPEACRLLRKMLKNSKGYRPTAAACLNHPFFRFKGEKKDLLCAVGNHDENRLSELKKVRISPIEQIDAPFSLPWEQRSVKHNSKLAQVARHQKSKKVDVFHYHSEPIGFGAFGHVHVGISEQDGQEIAVKRIELLRLCRPEDKREIETLLLLRDCEQVIKYQTFHKDEHFLYIILELMDGNLDELNCREEYHVDFCRDVMSGIAFLHSNGVIHRDIKPSNILYKEQPDRIHLKLADFGLSKNLNLTLPSGLLTVMHSKAYTRCWSPNEVRGNGVHSEASDVFSAGLVLHYILAEKKHPFAPKDETGMSEADLQYEIEGGIRKGQLNLSKTILLEACHLLRKMLHNTKDYRPTAAACLNHPFFWSKKKKKNFLCAVGNQAEIKSPCGDPVETDLEIAFSSKFKVTRWDSQIPQIYTQMAKFRNTKPYKTYSAVDLLRFIRNSYAHPCSFTEKLFDNYVYLDKFPTLVITVYDVALVKHKWDRRKEIIDALS